MGKESLAEASEDEVPMELVQNASLKHSQLSHLYTRPEAERK